MGVCMYRYINTAFLVWLGCLCVYDFKADCFILNKQLGGSFNTNSPSLSTHQRPLIFLYWVCLCESFPLLHSHIYGYCHCLHLGYAAIYR